VPTSEGPRSYERTNPNDAYEINGFHRGLGALVVTGKAQLSDGSVRNLAHSFQFGKPMRGSLSLAQTDRYWGRVAGQPNWEWTVQIRGSLADIADIRQVIYHLHPSFPTPERLVGGTYENGFAFTTVGWGTFPLRATLYFQDGSTTDLNASLQFRDPVRMI
jgi:hypothetical protein